MNQAMRLLSSFEAKNKKDSLKYAYAFMLCKGLYMKECSFFNPHPKQIDSDHVYPRDAFSATYSENDLPPWKEFRSNLIHFSSPSFNCIGSLDLSDQERLMCASVETQILFCCYGNYEANAQKVIKEIQEIYKTLE
jgi:hypothetical protein